MEQKTNPSEQRTIGYIEGRLEGLATKSDLADLKLDVSQEISNQTKELSDKIDGVRSRQTKLIGAAVGIGFVLSLLIGASNLAVNLGWIQTATG
ncbi:MAG: hypothetical protein OXG39_05890 [Chloroflexi bacterium]|nr:hypothetical protein [Chloroflexota bacterium]